jgi:RNA polymerase sigma-70 factor, ECF subfamily
MPLRAVAALAAPLPEPPAAAIDDASILQRFQAGQTSAALNQLIQRDGRAVYSLCLRILRDTAAAEDVMQQVFIEACRDFKSFAGKSNLRGWLLGIANHRCLDAVRRRKATVSEPTVVEWSELAPHDSIEPGDNIDVQRRLRALEVCLEGLSEEVRATLLLRFQSGLSYEVLSTQTGQQPATLQARVARALPVLRECLEKKGLAP